jgi:4-hydroxy-2-oxoheptanedioate aldolase
MRPNRLHEIAAAKRTALVGWMSFANPYAAEFMGHAGFDAIVIDLQHGPLYLDAAIPMLQALSATPAMPMVRCSANNFFEIGKLLDAGAYSIICPLIEDADDARRFVGACRYPPLGTRSYGPTRGFLYGGPDYFEQANNHIVAWAMIETPQSIQQLDAICAVEGLDGVFIGPTDLSISLGVQPPPKWREAPLSTEIARVLAAARKAGKLAGIYCTTPEMAADMRRAGFDMVVLANDAVMLNAAMQQWLSTARKD